MVTHQSLKSPVVVPLPYAPENKFMSKAEFVLRNNKRKEIEAKTKAFADELKEKAEEEIKVVSVKPELARVTPVVKAEEPKPVRKYTKKTA